MHMISQVQVLDLCPSTRNSSSHLLTCWIGKWGCLPPTLPPTQGSPNRCWETKERDKVLLQEEYMTPAWIVCIYLYHSNTITPVLSFIHWCLPVCRLHSLNKYKQHHQLSGQESEQTLGHSGGQRSLACCSPCGRRVGHDLVTEQQPGASCAGDVVDDKASKNPCPPRVLSWVSSTSSRFPLSWAKYFPLDENTDNIGSDKFHFPDCQPHCTFIISCTS